MAGNRGKVSPAPDTDIPDRLYFKIGEVAALVGVETHVLRYWEKEIPSIRPTKTPSNQRRYRRRDVETFREIRRLLYEERYTLAGARRRLSGQTVTSEEEAHEPTGDPASAGSAGPDTQMTVGLGGAASADVSEENLEKAKDALREILRMVGEPP